MFYQVHDHQLINLDHASAVEWYPSIGSDALLVIYIGGRIIELRCDTVEQAEARFNVIKEKVGC